MHAGEPTTRVAPVAQLLPNRGPQVSFLRHGLVALALLFAVPAAARAQWQLLDPPTTADLRGIDNVGGGVAWASGTNGTVLRTEDGGYMWQHCSIPPGAEKLDFRGIQAFDANTAIVMSSGKGDLSRLYKTTDGCHSWNLLFTNPDPAGFWDALLLNRFDKDGMLLGDPVNGKFAVWKTGDKGLTWRRSSSAGLSALPNEGAFAASNSSLSLDERTSARFGTGGLVHPRVFVTDDENTFHPSGVPMRGGSAAAGIFSMEYRDLEPLGRRRRRLPEAQRSHRHSRLDHGRGPALASRSNPAPRLPQRRRLRPREKNLDHRRPQRHRHLHR